MSSAQPGKIRIVGGSHRGRLLKVPASSEIRPTAAKVREAVFDVLGPVHGLAVLDLFAGTGAYGLEALSRGARGCVFVEGRPQIAVQLRANINLLGYEGQSRVIVADFRKALDELARATERFDLLFVDPPYRMLAGVEVTLAPLVPSLLSEGGLVVVEGPGSNDVTFGRAPVFDRIYGRTRVRMISIRRSAE